MPDLKRFLIFSQKKPFQFSGNGTFLYFGKGIFRTLAYSQPKVYSKLCQTSMAETFCENSYLAHFLAQARKTEKIQPPKFPFISGNRTF